MQQSHTECSDIRAGKGSYTQNKNKIFIQLQIYVYYYSHLLFCQIITDLDLSELSSIGEQNKTN